MTRSFFRAFRLSSKSHLSNSKTLLLGGVSALLMMGGVQTAQAQQCVMGAGNVVTCSGGYIGTPYIAPTNTAVTVNVESGTTVQGSGVGVQVSGTGDSTINNFGTIQDGSTSVEMIGVAGFTKTLNNNGTLNGGVVGSGDGTIIIRQNGQLNGPITITGNGNNELYIGQGLSVNGLVSITGATNLIDNSGFFNNGLTLVGTVSNTVINRQNAQISTTSAFSSPDNQIDNSGTINNGLSFTGNSSNAIFNRETGTIHGDIVSTGSGSNLIDNTGLISNNITLGSGIDILINRPKGTVQDIIQGTIDLGAGNDSFNMLGGVINGQILLGTGDDVSQITGGLISTSYNAGPGNDELTWSGGNISAGLTMDTGDDYALFQNLTTQNLTTGMRIDGGLGNDFLRWDNTKADGVDRYVNWEVFDLTNGSELTFANYATLKLGDAETGTGKLSIDATSTVFAGNGTHSVAPFTNGALVNVTNAGTIDLTNNNTNATDRFVVYGNYVGQNGRIDLQTVLGADNSPSDQLVISGNGASGTGSTKLYITNVGGQGSVTTGDGIRVVDAANGATTAAGAFSLGNTVAAGMFEYQLFRGGTSAGSQDSWFLRNAVFQIPDPGNVPAPPFPPDGGNPGSGGSSGGGTGGTGGGTGGTGGGTGGTGGGTGGTGGGTGGTGGGTGGSGGGTIGTGVGGSGSGGGRKDAILLIRPEAANYVMTPVLAQQLGLATLDTFHRRQGDQSLLKGNGVTPAGWARVFGGSTDEKWKAQVPGYSFNAAPKFDGTLWGLQAGLDLYGIDHSDGSRDRFGIFYSHAEMDGDVYGYTSGIRNNRSGTANLKSDSLGAYWTRVAAAGWYVDAVLMHSWYSGKARSLRGIGDDTRGTGWAASLETGYPIKLSQSWVLEPMAQIIWQRISMDSNTDPYSVINYRNFNSFTGRIGARLEGDVVLGSLAVKPFLGVSLWHSFSSKSKTVFNTTNLDVDLKGTWVEVNGGFSTQLSEAISLYAAASYSKNIGGEKKNSYGGNLGLRVTF
ncbi:autotransporter outer membrane beta-barrel domain-containing protein [Microvirga sp. W0021]|uniref:Autotransporter outer membrane beta-barrel domain-containing protein n=1 Tax=Hohaiivirga grylli TaxID=3133970 RepID=A0ABV0BG66_9HYPH